MKYIFYLHAGFCLIIGFLMLFNPELLLYSVEPHIQGLVIAKLYGIVVFCLGIFAFILSKYFDYNQMFKQFILCFTACHFAIGLMFYGIYNQNVTTHLIFCILHMGLAIITILIYLQSIQKFETK